jgi:hypothetical protein
MKNIITLFLIVSTFGFAQDKKNNISGKVTHLEAPLTKVEVKNKQSNEIVMTDVDGKYNIKASPGAILEYSYPGMRAMEIVVEDVTRILNIKLSLEVNQLEEVVVEKTVLKSQKEMQRQYAFNKNIINSAFGFIDKETTSFSMKILDSKDFTSINLDIASALQFKVAGIRVERPPNDPYNPTIYFRGGALGFFPAIYDVDGVIMTNFPSFLQIENIERVAVIRSLGAAVKYGGEANGGVIVINTKGANFYNNNSQVPDDLARIYTDYDGEAKNLSDLSDNIPTYLKRLLSSESEEEAIALHKEQVKIYGSSFYYLLDSYDYFANNLNNIDYADGIISDNWDKLSNNPLALKTLAYFYQEEGRFKKANDLYKKIFILRPNYSQSYMDMANSYREIKEYQKAADIYVRYGYLLEESYLTAKGKLGIIIDREFNNLLSLKGKKLLDKQNLKEVILDDEFDGTRLVFEWNDSEAEFELQFVNPEGNYYKSEHSLLADANRIRDEKISGFSSEEYFIDDSLKGVWQVNVKYFGNKRLTPTYLKTTIYYNYGSASQRKETKVFKLILKDVNQHLLTISNTVLVASN